ncbi:MAG: beta-glucosidase family protein [Dermatophilaceae bacterium]
MPDSPQTTTTGTTTDGSADRRVADLMAQMSLEEKVAQLVGMWAEETIEGQNVAPFQDGEDPRFEEFARHGLGHLTRVFGTMPVEPAAGRASLRAAQRWLRDNTRLGIPAIAHEECLTGLATWKATTYPTPLAWGATFDPVLIERMGAAIGESMASLGVHQGLAPVLDVVRDARWGRVEECISEDPFVVGELGSAYVRGLQSQGVVATLKHFVGYSASRAGRNLAPTHAGPREVADVLLVPFEMAVVDAGARSVMHSYSEIDGMPAAADRGLLTELLRDRWGFTGTVVSDYYGVAFLQKLHRVAESPAQAAGTALHAGIDIELPTGDTYLEPLVEAVRAGQVDEALVDLAVTRVLRQKSELGLLDPDSAVFDDDGLDDAVDLDPAAHRAIAAEIAEKSVTLLRDGGILPLAASTRVGVIGPNADRAAAMFGCYSYSNHVLDRYPEVALGIEVPTLLDALRTEFDAVVGYAEGCGVSTADTDGIAAAVELAKGCEVAVVAVGDHAGIFGRGTSGEGCDTDSLELPGVQRSMVEAVLDTGTPVVLVVISGRPYSVAWAADRGAALIQAFFPGQDGARAVSGVLSGRVNPSGRLAVSISRSAGVQPYSYLHPELGGDTEASTVSTRPEFPFGAGLGYTTFEYSGCRVRESSVPAGGVIEVELVLANTGERQGEEVVQIYAQDVAASVTRPLRQLLAFTRVAVKPGASRRVALRIPTSRLAFSGRDLVRVVEPGEVRLWVGSDCETEVAPLGTVEITGPVHRMTTQDSRAVDVLVM